MTKYRQQFLAFLLGASGIWSGTQAWGAADEPPAGGLAEVTVTATRRSEVNLQEAPLAVTAVTTEQIQNIVPRDVSEVAALVPNFSAARITAFNAASFAMRGAGQTDIIVYLESPVAVLVDEFVVPSVQTQLLDTFDLESVEVLRGPQGTLFGKNTTGGAIVVRTKRPTLDAAAGELQLGLGSFERRQVGAAVNLPLARDKFAIRLVGNSVQTDGYYRNGAAFGPTVGALPSYNGLTGRGNGERVGGTDVVNGRLKALWQVTDDFSALLQFEV
ncbi:MAG: TonB-dependent receptor plug domain-containing protein, partial [Steroidobacteraceae bacterium]|nr:TonB-dependent receptor plug domain-containing protein [Steroidobacteraceae bacterium]